MAKKNKHSNDNKHVEDTVELETSSEPILNDAPPAEDPQEDTVIEFSSTVVDEDLSEAGQPKPASSAQGSKADATGSVAAPVGTKLVRNLALGAGAVAAVAALVALFKGHSGPDKLSVDEWKQDYLGGKFEMTDPLYLVQEDNAEDSGFKILGEIKSVIDMDTGKPTDLDVFFVFKAPPEETGLEHDVLVAIADVGGELGFCLSTEVLVQWA